MSRYLMVAAILALSGCTVRKTASSAGMESAAATESAAVKAPMPSPAPAPAPNPPFTSKDLETTNPKPATKPTAGGERDSVVKPALEIGADGKIHRAKR